jgi:hypothetical protein
MNDITTPKVYPTFNIIHQQGECREATTLDGYKVYRETELLVPDVADGHEYPVRCAPDQDHFVYAEPTGLKGRPAFLCTCGSMAVVVGPKTHRRFSSLKGEMLMCFSYMQKGKHNTSLAEYNYGHKH